MEEAGLTDVKLTCCDWAGWENARGVLADMKTTGGEDMLDVISSHGYSQPLADPFDTDKEVWQSEWAELSSYFDQPWYSVEGDSTFPGIIITAVKHQTGEGQRG